MEDTQTCPIAYFNCVWSLILTMRIQVLEVSIHMIGSARVWVPIWIIKVLCCGYKSWWCSGIIVVVGVIKAIPALGSLVIGSIAKLTYDWWTCTWLICNRLIWAPCEPSMSSSTSTSMAMSLTTSIKKRRGVGNVSLRLRRKRDLCIVNAHLLVKKHGIKIFQGQIIWSGCHWGDKRLILGDRPPRMWRMRSGSGIGWAAVAKLSAKDLIFLKIAYHGQITLLGSL